MEKFNENGNTPNKGKLIKTCTIVITALAMLLLLKYMIALHITSVEDFRNFINKFGIVGPVVLTIFQAIQVVVPVLPGYLGCAAGAMAFGTTVGFICNYVGICAGSIASYFIARKLGIDVVLAMFSEKQYNKRSERICKKKSYDNFLFVATLLPLFPDDFLCYFSGLIKMNSKRFIRIILLGKPWCILAYSLIFGLIK